MPNMMFNEVLKRLASVFKKIRYFICLLIQKVIDDIGLEKLFHRSLTEIQMLDLKHTFIKKSTFISKLSPQFDGIDTIHFADQLLKHEFIFLGRTLSFTKVQINNGTTYPEINWHYDPINNLEYPDQVWYRHVRRHIAVGSDLKYPWELCRFQHLFILGQAYQITKDEQYVSEFCSQIESWIHTNPIRRGIHWSNTMEVGLRLANWTISLQYFISSSKISDRFLFILFTSMFEHAHHITNNYENLQIINSNHYIGDLFGLYVFSSMFLGSDQCAKWQRDSKAALEQEIINQTYNDGWDYEGSTAYHKLVTEMFMYACVIGVEIGDEFSKKFKDQLSKMLAILSLLQDRDGMIPQIGDNDSGFALKFNPEESNLNINCILTLASDYGLLKNKIKNRFVYTSEKSGNYLYRSKDIYFHFIAGPPEIIGLGSHFHNDSLSYIFRISGEDILVDPGSYTYSSDTEKRNMYRSVHSHNTLYWPGVEPRTLENGLFHLSDGGEKSAKSWTDNFGVFHIMASQEYADRSHQRKVMVNPDEKSIIIEDMCSHDGAAVNLHFASNCNPQLSQNVIETDTVNIEMVGNFTAIVEAYEFSPGYGQVRSSRMVKLFLTQNKLTHIIRW
jgi:hypothetical protein